MMSIYLGAMILLVSTMAFSKINWTSPFMVPGFLMTYYTLYVFLTVAAFATGMELCWKRVAATQFTLYMAIANLGRATGAGLLGPLRNRLEWEYVILSFAGFATVMLVMIQLLHLEKHLKDIDRLESNHLEKIIPNLIPAAIKVTSNILPKLQE